MTGDKFYSLPISAIEKLKKLKGPILIFGAGGFIGTNLLKTILRYRSDVTGVSQDAKNNWRFRAADIPAGNTASCDINDYTQLSSVVEQRAPKTIFNLSAYGALSKQKEYKKIYITNFNSSVDLVEILRKKGFSAYIQAGSSSEYGLNCAGPSPGDELIPDSHYAVSKAALWYAIKYYCLVEKLPVAHVRIYSAYGPWEEPDRLIPVLIADGRRNKFPPLVEPGISRDFIYIRDVCTALIETAYLLSEKKILPLPLNIGTGKKTTIKELCSLVKQITGINEKPQFGTMRNRAWDQKDWYANIESTRSAIKWIPETHLSDGLKVVLHWQQEVDFDNANWNWTRR